MKQPRIQTPELEVLPLTGKSRWQQIAKFLPVGRTTFTNWAKDGRTPKPERLGNRITLWDNAELHKRLADPVNYRAP